MAKERELSKKNPYWISKERTKELEWFCRQYGSWYEKIAELNYISQHPIKDYRTGNAIHPYGDPTYNLAVKADRYLEYIHKVKWSARQAVDNTKIETYIDRADTLLYDSLLTNVTEGKSYDCLDISILISREAFYNLRRKFFFILSSIRH